MACLAQQINAIDRQLWIRNEVSEDLLGYFYLKLKEQGLFRWLYFQKPPSLSQFLSWHKDPNSIYLGCFSCSTIEHNNDPLLAGMGWINQITRLPGLAKAEVSMAFLREFQRNGEALELARMMIEFAFDRVNLDALFGCTPIRNRAAVVFTQKCGFRKIGVAPMYCSWHGEPCDALLTVLTRAQWQADLKGEG